MYSENYGLVNPTGGIGPANIMGTGRADPYRPGVQTAIGLVIDVQGAIPSQFVAVGGFNGNPVPWFDPLIVRMNWPTTLNTGSVPEFANGLRAGSGLGPFGSAGAILKYDERDWPVPPVISIGGTDQVGWTTEYARYSQVGNLVFFRFHIAKTVPAFAGAGAVTVKNLPVAPGPNTGAGCVHIGYFSNYTPAGEIGTYVAGPAIQLNKGANRSADVLNTDLNAAGGILIAEGFYRIS